MPVLNLGVMDVPYQFAKPTRMTKGRKGSLRPSAKYTQSTVDVARILESKYHVMAVYFRVHGRDVANYMADDVTKALKNIKLGAPVNVIKRSVLQEAMSKTEDSFRKFLYTGEAERVGIPGTPTQASIDRKSLRFKSGVNPNGRPSFINTGLYERSFRAWVTDK